MALNRKDLVSVILQIRQGILQVVAALETLLEMLGFEVSPKTAELRKDAKREQKEAKP